MSGEVGVRILFMPHSVSTCLAELMAHFLFLTGLVANSGLLAHLGFSSVGRGYF